jgi:hypothetical protein
MNVMQNPQSLVANGLFQGTREQVHNFLKSNPGRYYVYILRRPDLRPFYVGKGKAYRLFTHVNEARHIENSHKLNVIRSIKSSGNEVTYEIESFYDDEAAAHRREMAMIGLLKRTHEGGYLTNRTAGGEGGSDPSPESREKHRQTLGGIPDDDSDRAALNRFFLSVAQPESICIKPESGFKVKPTKKYPSKKMGPTIRQAAALSASAISNGIILEPGRHIPRRLVTGKASGFVENGVSCDIVTSGMATLSLASDPRDEIFVMDDRQINQIVRLIGAEKLTEAGIWQ